jgi:integration host factor subunit beta
MPTITKRELIERISLQTGIKRGEVKDVLQHFLDEIIRELKRGNRLEFRDFGVFEIRERAARRAQNPRTLEQVMVPSRRSVKFKVGRLLRELGEQHPQTVPAALASSETEANETEAKPAVVVPTGRRKTVNA